MNNSGKTTNKYVSFVSDEHLLKCIENIHSAYVRAKNKFSKKTFYSNKVDTIKMVFDTKFNDLSEDELIKSEVSRQIDKSVNNAIGAFHEQVMDGIEGFEMGNLSGFDIKATDNSLFADIKNKHNTMNSSSAESLFQKLARYADDHKKATCYWVQVLSTKSFDKRWFGIINGKEYSHSRVRKISGDKFYALLTGEENAFFNLYKALPRAIDDFLKSIDLDEAERNTILSEITENAEKSGRNILDEITFENFSYYLGFDKLK